MKKKKILLVDDDVVLTQILKSALERSGGYEVQYVNEGMKAMAVIRSFGPDLIVLDVQMPDIQGDKLCAAIESDPVIGNTPIIFLTAMASDGEMRSGIAVGNHPTMGKPIHMEKLIECIEKKISGR